MPNWCANTLVLSHKDPVMVQRAKQAFLDNKLCNEFVPVPEELVDTVHPSDNEALKAKYGYSDWYDFCVGEWGTKWDVGGEEGQLTEQEDGELSMIFDSAWAPPIEFYAHLQRLGFHVSATYHEPGMAFAGTWVDGADECYDYSDMTADEIEAELPASLNDEYGISSDVREWEDEE